MPHPADASSRHTNTSTAATQQQQPYERLDESRLPAAKGLRRKTWLMRGIALAVLLGEWGELSAASRPHTTC
jgi:hypothetical protein